MNLPRPGIVTVDERSSWRCVYLARLCISTSSGNQAAPRLASTADIVFHKICRSSVNDQFST